MHTRLKTSDHKHLRVNSWIRVCEVERGGGGENSELYYTRIKIFRQLPILTICPRERERETGPQRERELYYIRIKI